METWREELYANELYHFGVKGMKWGQRRYQNADGSLTSAGAQRYGHSLRGNLHRLAAANYGLNERSWSKGLIRDKTYARYNKRAKERSLAKAEAADKRAYEAREQKRAARQKRRESRRSFKGNMHRTMSEIYALNERTYRSKLFNNEKLADMNAQAKSEALRRAEEADRLARERRRR